MRFVFSSSRVCAAALIALLAGPPASAGDTVYVICNPSVHLAMRDLRDVFLGERQFAGMVRLAPADNRAAQSAFLARVLMMAPSKYSTSWTKKSFRDGVNPPPVKSGDAEAIEYVRHQQGACSYSTTPPGAGVEVVGSYES
jgi:hypothetical protein